MKIDVGAVATGEWQAFLQRKPLALNRALAEASFGGKRILITGAGGWIGSALAKEIAAFAPEHLVLLEAAERSLYEIDRALQQMPGGGKRTSVLGSVTQPEILDEIFLRYQPQIVYHAAAFKHVPLMERNPFAAIENNALGTNLLVQAAVRHGAEKFILLSTDKAVDPASIMGASKRIAELVLLRWHSAATPMRAVRLGNVLESEGSVVPLFLQQILKGGPVTVTHSEARRYFLTTEDAVTLLLEAASSSAQHCILVPELGEPVLMESLARYLIARMRDGSASDVPIEITELRPGDKMCEALLSARESYVAQPDARPLRAVSSPGVSVGALKAVLDRLQQACRERSLEKLSAAVVLAVPEYRPSALLESALRASAKMTGETA